MMTIPEIKQTCDRCGKDDIGRYEIADAEFFLCVDCATQEGFCLVCGGFFGGTEEWFHSGIPGCCADCATELNMEFGDGYEPEDFEY